MVFAFKTRYTSNEECPSAKKSCPKPRLERQTMAVATSRTDVFLQARAAQVPRGVGNTHPIFVERALGAKLWDLDGKEYIDFVGGIGCVNIGHCHPKVVKAVSEQLALFAHTCFQVGMYPGYVELARRLNELAPGDSKKKTFFVSTGAEAVENAIKIARSFTGRPAVVAFHHSFHGRTLLALTMTGENNPYKQSFGPFAGEVYHAPYPYEFRGWTAERALDALEDLFESQVTPNRVAAIIVEPVLGEGGFVVAPVAFLKRLRELTSRHGILLIADEIQSGYGRTGKMFAIEHAQVEPDLITVAKSMANGLPLAGVIGKAEIIDAPAAGGLGGTFGGNPLACAAALAVLDVIEEERILDRAVRIGHRLEQAFAGFKQRYRSIGDARGLGAMRAIEFVDRDNRPDGEIVLRIVREARARGLLLMPAGSKRNVIRVLVPLVIGDGDLDAAISRLDESINVADANSAASP
jgi:4-aminobutyrate aminotransferase/(S)-3-amino-2-methylpropionate transaminase